MTAPHQPMRRAALGRGVEWEFDQMTISREFSRNVVTRLLVERAEHGGWELDRVRIAADGTRRVVLRRKIIRHAARIASTTAVGQTSSEEPVEAPARRTPARRPAPARRRRGTAR